MLKIAITGKMGSGKSSVTKIIKEIVGDAYVTSFSKPIRSTIASLDLQPTRKLMQATGDFFREHDHLVWTNLLLKEISTISKSIIIEGIRYGFEADKLASEGFKILKIHSDDLNRKKRVEDRDGIQLDDKIWDDWQKHGTEIYVDAIQADFNLENDSSIGDIRKKLEKLIEELKLHEK